MGKVKKIIVALFLAALTAFSFAGCNANIDEWQNKVDELQNRIEELEVQLQARDEEIAQLEEELENLKGETLTLDKELEEQIKQDYLEQYGYKFRYDCFYGKHSGCAIFFVAGDAAEIKSITIADQLFQYNYDWEIYVWRNGEFATLEEAYSAHWLTSEDINNIALNHSEFVKNK